LLQTLSADPETTVIPATRELFEAGCSLFARRTDKDWSLTDCISFVAMRQERLAEAFTADHHFEQAGFKALLQ
jgi:predicted nucleic acid-binding protein